MQRKILILLALGAVILLCGCNESDDLMDLNADALQRSLERLNRNENISYEMFGILSERMTSDSLNTLKANAATKAAFIDVVALQTKDYFKEVVEATASDFSVTTIPTPYAGEAEITLKALAQTESAGAAPFDFVSEYSDLVLKRIQEQAKKGKKEWVLINSLGSIGNNGDTPTESVAFAFSKIEFLATVPHTIIMDLTLSDEEVLTEINDVLNANDIPPVAIALLVPAVQKVREAAGTKNQPFPTAMEAWLDGPITEAVSDHGLDRDIIRRIQAIVYLAAVHTLLLEEYNGSNEDTASLSILHARYRAALITATEALWSK
jgi:hypothetical protein